MSRRYPHGGRRRIHPVPGDDESATEHEIPVLRGHEKGEAAADIAERLAMHPHNVRCIIRRFGGTPR